MLFSEEKRVINSIINFFTGRERVLNLSSFFLGRERVKIKSSILLWRKELTLSLFLVGGEGFKVNIFFFTRGQRFYWGERFK